jgi:predicted  nucleic acid-binding Zn-ribbon protein
VKEDATMTKPTNKVLLHACPRCQGDLFPDLEDEDLFACLQCGRRIPQAQVTTVTTAAKPQLAPAA